MRRMGGGSPGIEPTPVEFKRRGEGWSNTLHNLSETIVGECK